MKREYRVSGPHAVFGTRPGDTVTLTLTTAEEAYFLNAGHLERAAKKDAKDEPDIPCEYCAEHGTAAEKKARFGSVGELADHYREKHPALAPPEEV
jgi:hypothetical protein